MLRSSGVRRGCLRRISSLPPTCIPSVRSDQSSTSAPSTPRTASTIPCSCASSPASTVRSRSVWSRVSSTSSMFPIVPPASPIAVATRPSIPGRWSIRTRSVSENWAEVVGVTAAGGYYCACGLLIRTARGGGRASASLRGPERLVARRRRGRRRPSSSAGAGRAGGPASSQPSGPAIAEPATQLDAALVPAAVADRDRHAVRRGGDHRAQHLHRPLARPGAARAASWSARTAARRRERREPHPLRELEVVADHHADPAVRRVDHGGRLVARA